MTGVTDNGNLSTAKVYPVPASGNLVVEFEPGFNTLEISDAAGKTIFSYDAKGTIEKSISVPIHGWSQGIYFLMLKNQRTLVTQKITVE